MCPMCYINGLLFLLFGSSAAALAENIWVIIAGIVLTIGGFIWMWRSYQKNQGKGGLQRNLTSTFLAISSFFFGYLFAAYQTHDYFEEKYRSHQPNEPCLTCSTDGKITEKLTTDEENL